MINQANLDTFLQHYESALRIEHAAHPDQYAYPTTEIPAVVAKMRDAFERGATRARKSISIAQTWAALAEYLTVSVFGSRAPTEAPTPGAIWGRENDGLYHRIPAIEPMVSAACGEFLVPDSTYHADPKAGPDAAPVVGVVCAKCRALVRAGAK